jgi:predicted DCC family thiol-disulfide oxidoreductase YuxK
LRYERWAGQTAAGVKWLDVNAHETHLREKSIDPRAALLSLHVEDEQGHIRDGLDAYILLMRRVPRLKPMAGVIGLPGIKTLLSWCYGHWVKRRLAREGRLPTD